MKTRNGFVSNSSSTSFLITNKTKKSLPLSEFVKENPQLIEQFCGRYSWHSDDRRYTQESLIKSAKEEGIMISPGQNVYTFGDEQGTLIGEVFDYILRDGGESNRFEWSFYEYNR
jgi:hypothetical protein